MTRLMRRYLPFPTYTTPFIVMTWALFFLGLAWARPRLSRGGRLAAAGFVEAVAHGVGQVMFQASVWTALFFLVGIAMNDWRHASWVLAGLDRRHARGDLPRYRGREGLDPESLVDASDRERGARALRLQRDAGGRRPVPVAAVADPAAPGHSAVGARSPSSFPLLGLPALTAPFVLATWIVLALGWLEVKTVPRAVHPSSP